jgi:hypothetical protein
MCREGANYLLPQLDEYLALVINICPQPTVLFIEYVHVKPRTFEYMDVPKSL